MKHKFILSFLVLSLAFAFSSGIVLAQEEIISPEALEDQAVTAADLGISPPTTLPNSPFYFLKNWQRGLSLFFTFNPLKKAEKQLSQADEKMIEAKKIAQQTGKEQIVVKAMEKYQKTIAKAGLRIEKAKERYGNDARFQSLVDKFAEKQFLHQRLGDNLEEKLANAPIETKERFVKAREAVVANFGQSLYEIDGDKIVDRLDRILPKLKGSSFKPLKNLEVLKQLEDKIPEKALPAIKMAQENALKRLNKGLEVLAPEERKDKLERYLAKVRGNEARHLEVLEDLKSQEDASEDLLETIEAVKEKSLTRINVKLKSLTSQKEQELYLRHLNDGRLSRMRVLKEIENNLDPEQAEKLKGLKEKAIAKFKEKIASPEEREKLLPKLKGYSVGDFEVIEELEEKMPEDKKEFIRRMREKTYSNLQSRLDKAEDEGKKELLLKKVSGDDPKQVEVLRRVQVKLQEKLPEPAKAGETLERVIKKQTERVEKRIETRKIKESNIINDR